MATYEAAFSVGPKTLDSTTIDTVTLTLTDWARYVDVHSLDGTTDLTVTVARGTAPADPVPGNDDQIVIPSGRSYTIDTAAYDGDGDTIIKVLGDANRYLIQYAG